MRIKRLILFDGFFPIVLFAAGLGSGYFFSRYFSPQPIDDMSRAGGYEFVNPLLSCDISEDNPYDSYKSLQKQLQATINTLVAQGAITRASVYVRDMNNGHWTGANEDDIYIPASLMKVPLLIAYLKESEDNHAPFSKSLFLPNNIDENTTETIKPSPALMLGTSYTVQQLLSAMIEQSDNNAALTLNKNISIDAIDNVYEQFGVPAGTDENASFITPKAYMRFFRILYNASYLWRNDSKVALKMLSETDFKDGLVAGVPRGMTVSHKFGERAISVLDPRTNQTTVKTLQLHDCGIVYWGRSPYGICIMTEGADFARMKQAIAKLSNITYLAVQGGLLNDQ